MYVMTIMHNTIRQFNATQTTYIYIDNASQLMFVQTIQL